MDAAELTPRARNATRRRGGRGARRFQRRGTASRSGPRFHGRLAVLARPKTIAGNK